jgi:hypothetical protein
MSVSGNYSGGIVRPIPVRLTTTNATDIVTATDSSDVISSFSLANETGSAVVVDCHYNNGSTDFLVFRRSVPATDTVIISDLPIRLYSGDKFKVTAATGNAITVTPFIVRSHPNEAAHAPNGLGVNRGN